MEVFRSELSPQGCNHIKKNKDALLASYGAVLDCLFAYRDRFLRRSASSGPLLSSSSSSSSSATKRTLGESADMGESNHHLHRSHHPYKSNGKENGEVNGTFEANHQHAATPFRGHIAVAACTVCGDMSCRLHICLSCVFFGCWKNGHIQSHSQSQRHYFAVDVAYHHLYCFLCNDYVHDAEFQLELGKASQRAHDAMMKLTGKPRSRRKYVEFSAEEVRQLKQAATLQKCSGLRGLFNLGSTCFMNCVLQAIVHNPILRSYYLSDRHNKNLCLLKLENKGNICIGCELDSLFSHFYSGDTKPYAPHPFLYAMWSFSEHLAGYEQQDAHEFFISVLNGIHSHSQDASADECRCIAHQAFGGVLRSDVTCHGCGNVSSVYDPFFDISLDLLRNKSAPNAAISGGGAATLASGQAAPSLVQSSASTRSPLLGSAAANFNNTAKLGPGRPPKEATVNKTMETINTLQECLDKFTQPEKLGARDYICSNCNNTYQESTKQMSLKTLPQTLSLHLKRFEHSAGATKIDNFVQFEESLDMAPYACAEERISVVDGAGGSFSTHQYDLFAVIRHYGTMETGHYTIYVKYRSEWFKIDDATVTKVFTSNVLETKAYMLYYRRRHLGD